MLNHNGIRCGMPLVGIFALEVYVVICLAILALAQWLINEFKNKHKK
jgi:hypothetical protein